LYQDRFLVLAMENFSVGTMSGGSADYRMDRYVPMGNARGPDATANFNGTGTGISNINQGAVFLVFAQTNSATSVTNPLVVQAGVKYRFTDA